MVGPHGLGPKSEGAHWEPAFGACQWSFAISAPVARIRWPEGRPPRPTVDERAGRDSRPGVPAGKGGGHAGALTCRDVCEAEARPRMHAHGVLDARGVSVGAPPPSRHPGPHGPRLPWRTASHRVAVRLRALPASAMSGGARGLPARGLPARGRLVLATKLAPILGEVFPVAFIAPRSNTADKTRPRLGRRASP